MSEQIEAFWSAVCVVCGQTFLSDGEPCCADVVCQALMNRYFEQQAVVQEAEKILQEHIDVAELILLGL